MRLHLSDVFCETGYTTTMVGKAIFKRTHTMVYLSVKFSHAARLQSWLGDRKFSLPCCIIKHTLSALEQAHDSMRLWKLPSLQDLLTGVEDNMTYLFHNCK